MAKVPKRVRLDDILRQDETAYVVTLWNDVPCSETDMHRRYDLRLFGEQRELKAGKTVCIYGHRQDIYRFTRDYGLPPLYVFP